MRESGLFSKDQIRVMNETRMWAYWKLGRLLKGIERKTGSFKAELVIAVMNAASSDWAAASP
jgi:hypothetical protein